MNWPLVLEIAAGMLACVLLLTIALCMAAGRDASNDAQMRREASE